MRVHESRARESNSHNWPSCPNKQYNRRSRNRLPQDLGLFLYVFTVYHVPPYLISQSGSILRGRGMVSLQTLSLVAKNMFVWALKVFSEYLTQDTKGLRVRFLVEWARNIFRMLFRDARFSRERVCTGKKSKQSILFTYIVRSLVYRCSSTFLSSWHVFPVSTSQQSQ